MISFDFKEAPGIDFIELIIDVLFKRYSLYSLIHVLPSLAENFSRLLTVCSMKDTLQQIYRLEKYGIWIPFE